MTSLFRFTFLLKTGLFLLTLLSLSGCGFHLKHNMNLADKYPKIYLQSNEPNAELTRLVKTRLRGAGIEIASFPSSDLTILKIGKERRSTRTISLYVNAQNAEQELAYNLDYSIQNPQRQAQPFSVNIYRDFLDNPAQALAKSREAELLTKELRVIVAEHIITTLLTLDNQNNKSVENKQNSNSESK